MEIPNRASKRKMVERYIPQNRGGVWIWCFRKRGTIPKSKRKVSQRVISGDLFTENRPGRWGGGSSRKRGGIHRGGFVTIPAWDVPILKRLGRGEAKGHFREGRGQGIQTPSRKTLSKKQQKTSSKKGEGRDKRGENGDALGEGGTVISWPIPLNYLCGKERRGNQGVSQKEKKKGVKYKVLGGTFHSKLGGKILF